ncbi:MAG: lanthionine synthetase LanC family protein, partial [Acidimicrobiia bacterium]
HANKGGTYLAEDRLSGAGVVVKEGRPHVGGALDARDAVRHEAAMLARLAPTGRVPAVVDVFEQGGHVFLVTERVDGMSLRDLVDGAFDPPEVGVPGPDVAALSVRLAAAMAAVHAAGVVLRDFTPNNLMVGADGAVTIVDLELAHPADEGPATPAGTPGYASPEQLAGQPSGFADDYWSLGAVIAYVATGADPYFPSHSAHTWSDTDRLSVWMARLLAGGQIGARLADLVLGCMAAVPTERIGPAGVVPALTAERAPRRPRRAVEDEAPEPGSLTEWLLATMGEGTGGHLWPAGPSGMALDPANVQSGASGTGLYLCQAVRTGASDMRVRAAIAETAGWVSDRIAGGPRRPPGLHFGLTGMIWFLAEAADIAGRPDLRRHAGELALGLPVRSLNPDLSHGTAGIGLGQLHQWLRTGDERFLARAALAADHLVRIFQTSTVDGATALVWPVPDETPSRLAGTVSYGYAHGTAGIATFLLYAAAATGEDRFSSLGLAALRSLIPVAVLTPDGAAYWPVGPGNDELWPHWCNGSSGIGTAMLRAYAVSGDGSFLRFARAAALAGCREAWRSSPVQCHGLAGDAQLLLDLADVNPGDPEPWTGLASEAARNLWLRRRHERGWTAFADEGGAVTSAGLGTGTAGVGAFLLRWSHGGDRLLMLDELLG